MEKKQKKIHALMQGQTIPFHAMFASHVDATPADESEGKNSKKQDKKNVIRPKQQMKVGV